MAGTASDATKAANQAVKDFLEQTDAAVTLDRAVLDSINLGQTSIDQAITEGKVMIDGESAKFGEFIALLDTFEFWFDIVTP